MSPKSDLAIAMVMFVIHRPRMEAVALLIAAMFVIGDGLVRTGAARQLGYWLSAKAGANE